MKNLTSHLVVQNYAIFEVENHVLTNLQISTGHKVAMPFFFDNLNILFVTPFKVSIRPQCCKAPRQKFNNTPDHPIHPPIKLKLETIRRCFELGENVQLVSEEIGYSRASIYTWRKKFILKGATALMNTNDDPRGKLPEGEPASSQEAEQ